LYVTQQFDKYPTLFQRLRTAKPDAATCSSINWKPLADFVMHPATRSSCHEDDDAAVLATAQEMLLTEMRLDLLFVHLDDVDAAGHEYDYGPAIPEYVAAVRATDARVGALLASLRSERRWYGLEDWLVVVTTDHGGIDFTHEDSRPENRTNFILVQGSDVAAGEIFPAPLIVDVAPTVLAHLGVKIQSSWHLDGRPVGLKLTNASSGAAESFMDLNVSQDPDNLFPILPEELEAGPSPDAHIDDLAAEAAKLQLAHLHEGAAATATAAAAAAATTTVAPATEQAGEAAGAKNLAAGAGIDAGSRQATLVQLAEAAAVGGPAELERAIAVTLEQQERK
jgi:hypothetical protein